MKNLVKLFFKGENHTASFKCVFLLGLLLVFKVTFCTLCVLNVVIVLNKTFTKLCVNLTIILPAEVPADLSGFS